MDLDVYFNAMSLGSSGVLQTAYEEAKQNKGQYASLYTLMSFDLNSVSPDMYTLHKHDYDTRWLSICESVAVLTFFKDRIIAEKVVNILLSIDRQDYHYLVQVIKMCETTDEHCVQCIKELIQNEIVRRKVCVLTTLQSYNTFFLKSKLN